MSPTMALALMFTSSLVGAWFFKRLRNYTLYFWLTLLLPTLSLFLVVLGGLDIVYSFLPDYARDPLYVAIFFILCFTVGAMYINNDNITPKTS
jgi:hypothetical protein